MAKVIKKHGKTALIIGLSLMLLAMYFLIPESLAATAISSRSITISDSRPSATGVRYNFLGTYTSATTVKCLEIYFCTTASGGCSGPTGHDASTATLDTSNWSGWWTSTTPWTASTMSTNRVLYTNATGQAGGAAYAFSTASVANSTSPGTGGTYYARAATYDNQACTGSAVDSGTVAFAIVEGITISATVKESISFAFSTVSSANCDTTFGNQSDATTTATTVAFGTLESTDTFYHGCNDLTVSTNASGGYSVVAQETQSLYNTSASTDYTIDDSTGDVGITMTESTTNTWATAANSGFGYTCDDVSGSVCALTSTAWYRQFACVNTNTQYCDPGAGSETAVAVMSNGSPASANQSRIEYKLSASGSQEAGSYSNTVVYIATPTY